MKWILQYLRGTADVGWVYDNASTNSSSVVGFVDSDYVGDLDKRRFLIVYVFTLSSCTINWKVLHSTVALSTTEAEYMIATKAVKKAIWLKGLVGDLGLQQGDTLVFCDSQSTIHLTKNQMYHKRPKHIDVRYHFISENVSQGIIAV